ncbi:MAG: hypothetical protein GY804_08765 [Alphaproteobacteria bacterium]|nr:hypothetical protein [Alphaproteobacteria bacterium]
MGFDLSEETKDKFKKISDTRHGSDVVAVEYIRRVAACHDIRDCRTRVLMGAGDLCLGPRSLTDEFFMDTVQIGLRYWDTFELSYYMIEHLENEDLTWSIASGSSLLEDMKEYHKAL